MSESAPAKAAKTQRVEESRRRKDGPSSEAAPSQPARAFLGLQRAAGNRAVTDLARPSEAPVPAADNASWSIGESALPASGLVDPGTRIPMEERLGADLSDVRIHLGNATEDRARAKNAAAYASGRDIYLRRGLDPVGHLGRRVVAHELTHVVQQARGAMGAPRVAEAALEREASAVAGIGAAHGPTDVEGGAAPGSVQKLTEAELQTEADAADEGQSNLIKENLVAMLFTFCSGPLGQTASLGFMSELKTQLADQRKREALRAHMDELKNWPAHILELQTGATAGLGPGLISPITMLFDLAIFGMHMHGIANQLLVSSLVNHEILAEGASQLSGEFSEAGSAILTAFKENPLETALAIASLPEMLGSYAANMAGHSIAQSLIDLLEAPWKPMEEEEPSHEPLEFVSSQIERFKNWLLDTPWVKIGYEIGYAIGFALSNIALLILSDGIGNLLVKLGQTLGKITPALRVVGGIVQVAGRAIALVEEAIASLASLVLKPLEPILRPLLGPLESLRLFLRRLVGLSERGGAAGVEVAGQTASHELPTATTTGVLTEDVSKPLPETTLKAAELSKSTALKPGELPVVHEGSAPHLPETHAPPAAPGPAAPTAEVLGTNPEAAGTKPPTPGIGGANPTPISTEMGSVPESIERRLGDLGKERLPKGARNEIQRIRQIAKTDPAEAESALEALELEFKTQSLASGMPEQLFSETEGAFHGRIVHYEPSVERVPIRFDASAPRALDKTGQRLLDHVEKAVQQFETEGLTTAQLAALKSLEDTERHALYDAYRGSRIDELVKMRVINDVELEHVYVTANRERGADFLDSVTGNWYDMTTTGAWKAHVMKYGSQGFRLPTEPLWKRP